MRNFRSPVLAVLSLLPFFCSAVSADDWKDKVGVFVTPSENGDDRFAVGYDKALQSLKGHASTVWILESWPDLEKAPGQFKWDALDARVAAANEAGFKVGLRIQIILSGNNAQRQWVGVARIPRFYEQDMRSDQFREKAVTFYSRLAEHYRGKARYIAVGNTVNKYFERHPEQWEGFQKAYDPIVDAMHQAAPGMLVVSDVSSGGAFWENQALLKKYLSFFAKSHDDLVGLVFYFIAKEYYGGDFQKFNAETLSKVLDDLHAMVPEKKLYLIETACFSKDPKEGRDLSNVQARYVRMLMTVAKEKDYLAGFSWWQLYDSKDLPRVAWDLKAGFGLFDSAGQPKEAWKSWTEAL